MATDETDARHSEPSEGAPAGPPQQTTSAGDVDPEASADGTPQTVATANESHPADEEEGWPRSWIVIAAVLGIIAIIVVARLAGRDWREDAPPAGEPPGAPVDPAAPDPGKPRPPKAQDLLALDVKDVQLPSGSFCVGTDGKTHPYKRDQRDKKTPSVCKVMVQGASFRVEVMRADPSQELLLWVMSVKSAETPPILHALLMPHPRATTPTWLATNQGAGMPVTLQLINPAKTPVKLKRVRIVGRE